MSNTDLIHFLAIGRILPSNTEKKEPELLVTCSTQPNDPDTPKYTDHATKILAKSFKIQPGKRIRLTSDANFVIQVLSAVISGATIVFIAITTTDFGAHHNVGTLFDDWKNEFESRIDVTARKGSIEGKAKNVLNSIISKYNTSSLRTAQQKTEKGKDLMRENVKLQTDNLKSAEEMDDMSASIEASSRQFHSQTKSVKCAMCKEKWKSYAIGIGIIAVILTIILIVIFK